ncbi:4Fe-4S binding protein [Chloroflexota bacterium]
MRVGVFVCHCGKNIARTVNVVEVAEFARSLPNVVVAKDYRYLCSDPGQQLISDDIVEFGLDKVVIASCSPSMHQTTFMNNVQKAGLNPYCLDRANIREQCSWVHADIGEATEKAKLLLAAAVAKVIRSEPLDVKEVSVVPASLVIGGGITGIQAALDIGNSGFKVYLIEREPYLGGHVAQLNKTAPSLDDTSQILQSRIEELKKHLNIEVLTYSEMVKVEGYIGNFKVQVKRKPTYVNMERCTKCGSCTQACPVAVPDEFNLGLNTRAAVYRSLSAESFYLIDPESCLYFQGNDCLACREACKPDAIQLSQKEENLELEVGTIVVATGYDIFDARLKPEYGYGVYPNVITGLELERLASLTGPTGGKITINGKEPKSVVFIQCVGSRDKSVGVEYCSRVCCVYTAKQAWYIKDKIPEAKVTVCYIDIRAFGKGCEEFYEKVQKEGVIYSRGVVSEIFKKGDKVVVKAEDTLLGEVYEEEADLVVLATGLRPREDTVNLAKILNISTGADGFFLEAHPKLGPVETTTDGIVLAGCSVGPKGITDAVAQGHAAAVKASIPLFLGKVRREPLVASIDEEVCVGCRLCESACEYGALIFDERDRVMTVNEALCRGCGACSAICPSGANQVRNATEKQIFEMISVLI